MLEYLPLILSSLEEQGYEIVKINDLIYHENAHVNDQGCQVSDGKKNLKSDEKSEKQKDGDVDEQQ